MNKAFKCNLSFRKLRFAGWQGNGIGKRAFTLIELLVVVLIIGILAAVALPQYEKSVHKARLAEAYPIIKAMANACELSLLENGPVGDDNLCSFNFDTISIDIPGTVSSSSSERKTKNFSYQTSLGTVSALGAYYNYAQNDGDPTLCIYVSKRATDSKQPICSYRDSESEKLCKLTGLPMEEDAAVCW